MGKILFLLFAVMVNVGFAQQNNLPIIDIHLHAYDAIRPGVPASWTAEQEAKALKSPEDATKHLQQVRSQMKEHNIVLALTSSTSLRAIKTWKQAGPDLFIGGIQTDEKGMPIVSPDSLKTLKDDGAVEVLGELGLQYFGIRPDDPRMDPYYATAEKHNIPVCLHTGLGPPGGPHSFAPDFRTTLGKPTLFEPVLVKYPKLKAFLAHAGWPFISETIALLYIYPELYVDIGVLAWALPREAFYSALKELMDAGFGKRIMFGTDQMIWPGAIGLAIKTVQGTPFLSEEEKRDILYNNAARFLELSDKTIARHHQNR
ncbi:MAG: amidohydrolase family protein [Balneolaceae bacterium]|nr:amidohydrolase family protein [Balneolaceae bacterium]